MKWFITMILILLSCITVMVVLHNALPSDAPNSSNISYRDGMGTIPNRMIVATAFQFLSEWDQQDLVVAKVATATIGNKQVWFVALPWIGWTYGGQIDPQAGTISFAGL
jgi:hypothetical protein